ncbi:hypothetical protein SVIOM342S_07026 [Streptomyces violaceorubidus]
MSDDESYELLGFDNVLLPVGDLGEAVGFYERAGFPYAYRLDEAGIALRRRASRRRGVVLLVLGVMDLGNVYVLNRIRRRGMMEREQLPPVPPQGWVAPTTGA